MLKFPAVVGVNNNGGKMGCEVNMNDGLLVRILKKRRYYSLNLFKISCLYILFTRSISSKFNCKDEFKI